jgi:RNA polymerase sigma-70 factor (ECF subfamily)
MSQKAREGFAAGPARLSPSRKLPPPGVTAPRKRTDQAQAFRLGRAEERQLVRAATGGDPRAVRRLLDLLSGPIYRFGRGFCRDRHDAEDVMQEVLVSLTRSLPKFRGESSLATWAYTVARHACARQRRKGVHEPQRLESLEGGGDRSALQVPDRAQDPQRALERSELRSAIERAIAELPSSQKEVLVLRDVEGLTAAQVGHILGIQERAVKARLHRARVTLRELLAPWAGTGRNRKGARRRAAGPAPGRCPDTARLLSRYIEGELDAAVCARLEGHVSKCANCLEACSTLRGALFACRTWRGAPLPAEIKDVVRRAARQAAEELRAPA